MTNNTQPASDWKLVPVEPTEKMIIDGFESCPHPLFSSPKEWGAYEAMSGCQQAAHRARLCYAAMLAAAPAQPPIGDVPAQPVELSGVGEVLAEGHGFWRTCSGCHESEDGHPVGHYPYSSVLNCDLGGGCSGCGGIGAVWDDTDYEAMGRLFDAEEGPSCALGVGCEESGVCYAMAHGQPEQCGKPSAAPICDVQLSDDEILDEFERRALGIPLRIDGVPNLNGVRVIEGVRALSAPRERQEPAKVLTTVEISQIWGGMPGGGAGFRKEWGYEQFARAIERAISSPAPESQGGVA